MAFNNKIKPQFRRPIHLMIIAAHPAQDNGIEGFAKIYGCVLRSPNFEIEQSIQGQLNQ